MHTQGADGIILVYDRKKIYDEYEGMYLKDKHQRLCAMMEVPHVFDPALINKIFDEKIPFVVFGNKSEMILENGALNDFDEKEDMNSKELWSEAIQGDGPLLFPDEFTDPDQFRTAIQNAVESGRNFCHFWGSVHKQTNVDCAFDDLVERALRKKMRALQPDEPPSVTISRSLRDPEEEDDKSGGWWCCAIS